LINDVPQTDLDNKALKAVALQFLINGAVISSIIPRLPEIRDALQIDLSSIGQVLTMAGVGGILGSICSTWVLKRLGTKRAMIFGTLATIIVLPLVAFASSIWSLFIALALLMFLDPIIDIAMNLQGLVIGGGLLDSDESIQSAKSEDTVLQNTERRSVRLWIYALLGGAVFIPEMVGGDWSPFRAKDDLEASLGFAGLSYVVFTCGMVLGRLSGDYVSLKIGKTKHFDVAILMSVIGMMMACLVNISPLFLLGLFISGVGISVLFPNLYDMAAQDPKRPERALSVMTAGSRSITLLAPASIGFLADTETFNVGWSIAVFALPCLFIALFFMRPLIMNNTNNENH